MLVNLNMENLMERANGFYQTGKNIMVNSLLVLQMDLGQ